MFIVIYTAIGVLTSIAFALNIIDNWADSHDKDFKDWHWVLIIISLFVISILLIIVSLNNFNI